MFNKVFKEAPLLLPKPILISKLEALPKWKLIDNELVREHKFRDFEETWGVLTKVAMRSHLLGHHPTIITTYNKVQFRLTTHDVSGVSNIDLKLASRIEKYLTKV